MILSLIGISVIDDNDTPPLLVAPKLRGERNFQSLRSDFYFNRDGRTAYSRSCITMMRLSLQIAD